MIIQTNETGTGLISQLLAKYTTMLVGIHHVQITIPAGREAEAKFFYCNILGMVEIEKPDVLTVNGGFWMLVGLTQVHVGIEEDVNRFKTKAHIAYEVKNIDEYRKKLEIDYSIEIQECVKLLGSERIEFRDPFGNRVEIVEETA